jgi:hypothetical protein
MRRYRLLIAFLGLLSAACAGTPDAGNASSKANGGAAGAANASDVEISIAQAQAAIDEWLHQPTGAPGSAVVVAVRELRNQNWITADLRTKEFVDEGGHVSPTEDPAQAIFYRGGSGVWMLTRVVWDGGRMTATPEIDVR